MKIVKREGFGQLPRESSKAFAAFKAYLDLGPQRSLALVAGKVGKCKRLMERWSGRFDWRGRVEAHDAHVAEEERKAAADLVRAKAAAWVTKREDHRDDEWALRGELIEAGRKVLEKFRDGSRGATLGDVARALDLASKLGRLSSGLATETVEHTGEVDVNFRVEVEAAVKKAYGEVVDVETVKELPNAGS